MKLISALALISISITSHASYWHSVDHGGYIQSVFVDESKKYNFYGYSKINLTYNKDNPSLMAKSNSKTSVFYEDQLANSGKSRGFGRHKNYGIKGVFGYPR